MGSVGMCFHSTGRRRKETRKDAKWRLQAHKNKEKGSQASSPLRYSTLLIVHNHLLLKDRSDVSAARNVCHRH